jgi:phosphatidylserine/phosphatidylglycerophosphate/cardiolipin synthase-like enzyme
MSRAGIFLAATLVLSTVGCTNLPSLEGRAESAAFVDTDATRLGRAIAPGLSAHPGKTGIHALYVPGDAFATRYLLATAAERSLDVQYYIWRGDQTGYLLLDALWRAAARGVRVRLLLDDMNTAGLDETLAVLDAHPNIEVRLYNPLAHRGLRILNFLTDFTRVNRRMHNKSFTADNQATIVGGRNVGNEYFGAGSGTLFEDLDVLAIGPAVREVSKAFDLYWNSPSAYPVSGLVGEAGPDAAAKLEARFAAAHADPDAVAYVEALRETRFVKELLGGTLDLEWTSARLLRDDPAKTLDTAERKDLLLLEDLLLTVTQPEQSFDLVSPYFVPGEKGAADLGAVAGRGVTVRVLTNSLAATDVAVVHAGYAKRRRGLLEAGVQLYELKPTLPDDGPGGQRRSGGSSSASLHAKTFALDRSRIFVGSFNFDLRSALLNTEMGLMIESRALAQRLGMTFDSRIPREAYEVRLAGDGRLEWISRTPSGEMRYNTEPGTGLLKRLWIEFLSILPIEWLL